MRASAEFPMPTGQFTAHAFVARAGDSSTDKAVPLGGMNGRLEGGFRGTLSPEISEIEPPVVSNDNCHSHNL